MSEPDMTGGPSHAVSSRLLTVIFTVGIGLVAVFSLRPWRHPSLQWTNQYEAAAARAKTNNRLILIDFFATWCQPCRELERGALSEPSVERAIAGTERVRVDIDKPQNAGVRARYQVEALPTLMLVNSNGVVLAQSQGVISSQEFLSQFGTALAGHR